MTAFQEVVQVPAGVRVEIGVGWGGVSEGRRGTRGKACSHFLILPLPHILTELALGSHF